MEAAAEKGVELPPLHEDESDELWIPGEWYFKAFRILSESREFTTSMAGVHPQWLRYTEVSRYWYDHAADVLDTCDLEEFIFVLQEMDRVWMRNYKTK